MESDTMTRSSSYIHKRCKSSTEISGLDLSRLCDPFNSVKHTYCAKCENFDGLDSFHWASSGEIIDKWRTRQKNEVPKLFQYWRTGIGVVAGMPIGYGIGYVIGGLPGSIAGGVIGGLIIWLAGSLILERYVYKIDFRDRI